MPDHESFGDDVPRGVRLTAAWCWRLIVIGVVVYFIGRLFTRFQVVIVPVLVALLLVALVHPMFELLLRAPTAGRKPPRGLAALVTILVTLAVISGLIALIGQQVATGFPTLQADALDGIDELQKQLANSPLHVTNDQISGLVTQATDSIRANSSTLVSGALQVTSTALDVGTGFFVVLFSTFFFLSGGSDIWGWLVRLFPRKVRSRVDGAGVRAWATLTAFVRATVIVALVDGTGVGVVAAVLGLPLALPLGVLVFIGAFVPVIGALVSGTVAVLVALVAKGWVATLIMLAGVIVVQQVEAHVLQPFLLGRAVRVHPLAVILAIAAGVILAGVVGALFAVPFIATANVAVGYLNSPDEEGPLPEPEDAGPLADEPEEASPPGRADSERVS